MNTINYYYIIALTVTTIVQIAMFGNIVTASRRPKDSNLKPESSAFLILAIIVSVMLGITILEAIKPTGQDGIPNLTLILGPLLIVATSIVGYFSSKRVESDLKVQSSKVKNLLIFTLLMDLLVTILSILLIRYLR